MRTLELLDYVTELARRLGYEIREEWLDGAGGGACEIRGQHILFVDLSLSPQDRLWRLASVLRGRAELSEMYILPEVRSWIEAA
jgi:hypothetical protein